MNMADKFDALSKESTPEEPPWSEEPTPQLAEYHSNPLTNDAMAIPEDGALAPIIPVLPTLGGRAVAADATVGPGASTSNAPNAPMSARDVAYAFTTTLAFVSPHTFGENARHVKATTDGLEARVAVLEQQAGDDGRLARLIAAALAPLVASVQQQIDALVAATQLQVSNLTSSLGSLEQQLKAELLEANALKARLAAVEEGGLDHSHERIDALEVGSKRGSGVCGWGGGVRCYAALNRPKTCSSAPNALFLFYTLPQIFCRHAWPLCMCCCSPRGAGYSSRVWRTRWQRWQLKRPRRSAWAKALRKRTSSWKAWRPPSTSPATPPPPPRSTAPRSEPNSTPASLPPPKRLAHAHTPPTYLPISSQTSPSLWFK
jgi:hypothetical protein